MKSLIVYNTHKGNTRKVAEAIADVLRASGTADVVAIEDAPRTIEKGLDLLLVGGPTEGHGMTPEVRDYLDRLEAASLAGVSAAAFDTRIDWPRLLSGSAADGIGKRLAEKGARVVNPQGSFLVDTKPELKPGELGRAREWAATVSAQTALATVG